MARAQKFRRSASIGLCSLAFVLAASNGRGGEGDGGPTPLPGNPAPKYPEEARLNKIEGEVRFRVRIDEAGQVERVEILSVPKEGIGFEEAVREALTKWRFDPARENGRAKPATLEEAFSFLLEYPDSHGRIYAVSSDRLWSTLLGVLNERKFRFETFEEENGLVVTQWLGVPSKPLKGLGRFALQDRFRADSVQLHIFIPPFAEPGRLYINSMVAAHRGTRDWRYYNTGHAERWLYALLEESLGQRGRALPKTPLWRSRLAIDLMGQDAIDPCGERPGPFLAGVGNVSNPTIIAASKITPLYPEQARLKRGEGIVILQALVYEDGWVGDIEVLRSSGPDPEFKVSAAQTVSFWRYKPAMQDGCPVAAYFTVVANYEIER